MIKASLKNHFNIFTLKLTAIKQIFTNIREYYTFHKILKKKPQNFQDGIQYNDKYHLKKHCPFVN